MDKTFSPRVLMFDLKGSLEVNPRIQDLLNPHHTQTQIEEAANIHEVW
jgi:hypothetical protein